ncbi:Peptidoglycan/xylan/chitin deacetylase, PgdA/CDA1 family [Evansella caseinilytica]|uniref:Peptidoglycan/xylan/chitin deacetylase, PgdA/CDA1 family n=1 Tax=Evansella caseinilytica TaxID=1503961 RepID=A0A1H3RI09_9BACI|nr:polysaccharide deacetylase family protein [Evansella caseinilytica]SDZ25260.1 Peptidoglycan/xylan/chitin deacetylase, PgdA/CDA1 family [Evansella caseinilytica]
MGSDYLNYFREPPPAATDAGPVYQTEEGAVAVTFDDGPSLITEQILDVLRQKNARAIFFMVGTQIESYPSLAQRAAAEGHFIGNHSYSHPYFTELSMEEQEAEIVYTSELIKNVTGIVPQHFRPPYGAFNEATLELCRKHHLQLVMWNADPKDYMFNTRKVLLKTIKPLLFSRAILLLHDLKRPSAEVLPNIIDTIRERGLGIAGRI